MSDDAGNRKICTVGDFKSDNKNQFISIHKWNEALIIKGGKYQKEKY